MQRYNAMLIFHRFKPPRLDMSNAENQAWSFPTVVWTGAVSLRLQSKTLPGLVTGFSVIDGIVTLSTEK